MLYRDNQKNIRDIWAGISTNKSQNFSTGFNADKNKWMMMSCPSSGPDGAIIGDSLYSVFMSGGSGKYRTYISISSLSGGQSDVSRLSGEITGLGQQNYPRIAINGKSAAIVWRQNISGTAQLPILFTDNIQKGFPSTYELVDAGDVTNTDVAISSNKVFVVWEDDKSGTVKYRIGNYTPSVSVNEADIINFTIYPNPAKNNLVIKSGKDFTNAQIKITNALGQTTLYMVNQKNTLNVIDISSLHKGIYFIQITSGNQSAIRKFIKE